MKKTNKKNTSKSWNDMSRSEKTIGIVVLIIIVVVIISIVRAAASGIESSLETNNDQQQQEKVESKTEKANTNTDNNQQKANSNSDKEDLPKQTNNEISQSDAEDVCQDANFLQNYIDINDTSIVTFSYSPYFSDMGDGTKSLQWNGKDNSSGDSLLFTCDVSKANGKTTIDQLVIDSNVVYESN